MKKALGILSTLAIVAAVAQLLVVYVSVSRAPLPPATLPPLPPYPTAVPIAPELAVQTVPATSAPTEPFGGLPLDQPRQVSFAIDPASFDRLSPRQQIEQLRDWLLFTAVAQAGLSAEQLSQILFDLPSIRYSSLNAIANFEFGDTRSLVLDDQQVLALLPVHYSPEQRHDALAHIADGQRKSMGAIPGALLVFEYELDLTQPVGTLTRRAAVPGAELFTEQAGYVETAVTGLPDFERLLSQIDDITFADLRGSDLVLGGRKLRSYAYRGVRVEDIAAVWQSERQIKEQVDAFNRKWDAIYANFNRCWASQSNLLPSFHAAEAEALQAQAARDWQRQQIDSASGFSLDYQLDYAGLGAYFEQIEPQLRSIAIAGTSALTRELEVQQARNALGLPTTGIIAWPGGLNLPRFNPLRLCLEAEPDAPEPEPSREPDARPFFQLIEKIGQSSDPPTQRAAAEIDAQSRTYWFQQARYDGDLQGTEVGMLLFYTDLLAKLWSLNYADNAPDELLAEFTPMTRLTLPQMYRQNLAELDSTRLWFGSQHKGFQLAEGGASLLLARNATRLYALSSRSNRPDGEMPANASSAMFLGWWDQHYEEVARVEQEYERLNQIMKWSLIVGWLNERNQGSRLGFLQDVPVERGHWFPDWVRQRPELYFQSWDAVGFYPPGHLGTATETMPLLISESFENFGESWVLSGGVSLASSMQFADLAAPPGTVAPWMRRSFIDYAQDTAADALQSFSGTTYQFQAAASDRASVLVTPGADAQFQTLDSELAHQPFTHTFAQQGDRLTFATSVGDAKLGELSVSGEANGFAVGWQAREIDLGQSLALRLTRSDTPDALLMGDPHVASAIRLAPDRFEYMVRFHGSDRWMLIMPETQPSARVAAGFEARVTTGNYDVPALQLAWLDDQAASEQLGSEGYLAAYIDSTSAKPLVMNAPARGPPDGATQVRIISGDVTLNALVDPQNGDLVVSKGELLSIRPDAPGIWAGMLGPTDIERIRSLAAGSGPFDYRVSYRHFAREDALGAPEPALADYGQSARELAQNPAAFGRRLDQTLADNLLRADLYLAEGRAAEARQLLADLAEAYGPLPDIQLRIGVALLSAGEVARAAETLNGTQAVALRDGPNFYAEINSRLAASSGAVAQGNLTTLARFAEWHDLRAQQGRPAGALSVAANGDRLELVYQLESMEGAQTVAVGELAPNRRVYIQDSPGLNNLDWSVSIDAALFQVESGQLGNVVRLPRGPINRFNPTVIYTPDGAVFRLSDLDRAQQMQRLDYYDVSSSPPCEEDEPGDCPEEPPVYLVRAVE